MTSLRTSTDLESRQAVAFGDVGGFIEAWVEEGQGNRPALMLRATQPARAGQQAEPTGLSGERSFSTTVLPLGQSDRVLNPTVERIDGEHFFVAWLEGSVEELHVRAVGVTLSGKLVGAPLLVGDLEGSAIGMPKASFGEGGRGRLTFAASTSRGFRSFAVPVACPL